MKIPHLFLSIIVTTVKDGEDLTRALNSCVNQSYKELDIIVVNYGGTEFSLNLTDERITVYHKKESNINEARNFGLAKAKGEYVTFLESNQELHELWLEKGAQRLYYTKYDGVQCGTMYEKDNKIDKLRIANDSIFGFYKRLLIAPTIPINSLIIKRSICTTFPIEKPLLGEWEFFITSLKDSKVDVQGEFFGSIIHLKESIESEKSIEYEKERLEIMEKYYNEIPSSLSKIFQKRAILKLKKRVGEVL
ncbi:MAG: glycosyltransferase family 2 protein [Spirochaetia bacterium]|nr:glycosyltransferase family 2 protein [Spirochaetia bacterium]